MLNIFVNHVSVGFVDRLSPSRILFFDSADAFVLLAGISSFLAYGPRPEKGAGLSVARILRRCRTIYLCNLLIIACSILILLIVEAVAPSGQSGEVTDLVQQHRVAYIWHLISLQQSVAYSVVLRLYVLLLLVTPIYIWLAAKRFWYPAALAGAVWLMAGHFGWVEHDSLTGAPLRLTFLPWNLLFAMGVTLGAAIRADVQLPRSTMATALSLAVVLAGPICFVLATRVFPDVLGWVNARDESFWLGASKRFQSPLRVASLIGFVYLFITFSRAPVCRLIHQVSPQNLFCALGRNSLKVFTVSAIVAVAFHQALLPLVTAWPEALSAVDFGAVVVGFILMIWIARRGSALRSHALNSQSACVTSDHALPLVESRS